MGAPGAIGAPGALGAPGVGALEGTLGEPAAPELSEERSAPQPEHFSGNGIPGITGMIFPHVGHSLGPEISAGLKHITHLLFSIVAFEGLRAKWNLNTQRPLIQSSRNRSMRSRLTLGSIGSGVDFEHRKPSKIIAWFLEIILHWFSSKKRRLVLEKSPFSSSRSVYIVRRDELFFAKAVSAFGGGRQIGLR